MVSDDTKKGIEELIIKEVRKQNLSLDEAKNILKRLKSPVMKTNGEYCVGKNNVRYMSISDTHIGSTYYDAKLMRFAANIAKKEKVDFIIHSGDVVDGWYQNRPQQIFELNAVGVDQQVKLAIEELSQFDVPFYFITANHEYNCYMRSAGVEVGSIIEDKLVKKGLEAHFLGNDEGNIKLKKGATIKMLHPDGGSSYAISYKSQKIVESLEGGKKPNILHIAHFHKLEYCFFRNVHAIQSGTFQNQTKFMKGKHLTAMKGFYVIDVVSDDVGGISCITPKLYPCYE